MDETALTRLDKLTRKYMVSFLESADCFPFPFGAKHEKEASVRGVPWGALIMLRCTKGGIATHIIPVVFWGGGRMDCLDELKKGAVPSRVSAGRRRR